jgi:uncharacterized protein (TIGR02246 family)
MIVSPLLMILAAVPVLATEPAKENAAAAEPLKTIASFEETFNRADAKGLAACFASEGEFVGPSGDRLVGRDKIEAAFTDFLAKHPKTKIRFDVVSCRSLADGVAVVDVVGEMTPAPRRLDAESASTVVLLKREGRWLIGSMHEVAGAEPSHRLRLKDLQWMVGVWAEEASRGATRSECDWAKHGNYLIRKFTTAGENNAILGGTEVIGWDPRAHRIRSWTFDSDGGFGESTWTRDGDHWVVRYSGILADGGDVSATHLITPVDANTITLQSKDRTLDGAKQPDLPEITIKRQLPPAEAKSGEPSAPAKVLP